MAPPRTLPEGRNPLLEVERSPATEILVERRCLGQTELKVKPGQIGTSNATKPDNLGTLDYAHLRVPLPKDLKGSGIFSASGGSGGRKYPEAYFLMRRSVDGFISATGMFKAAFPWASQEEEIAEKEHIKSLPSSSPEEVAGNAWIPPHVALELADEYGLRHWVLALLDPEPIAHGTHDPNKAIKSPPPFDTKKYVNGVEPSPSKPETKMSTRGRSMRSASPSKSAASVRKIATPRKTRKGRSTAATTSDLSAVDELTSGHGPSAEAESVNGDAQETVKVEVTSSTQANIDGEEVETTKVNIELPAHSPNLPLPKDPQAMIEEAREMVERANEMTGGSSSSSRKRKADEIAEDEEDDGEMITQPAKRVRTHELELRKERIKRRAMTGIAATLVLGALVPLISTAFPW